MSLLGKGAYGQVTKQHDCAVKKFTKLPHLIQEEAALTYLKDCHYIVHSRSVDYLKNELTMELYDTSLRKWLSKECCCKECLNQILHDVLCGLVELQDRGLSHSDLKPGNILIKKPLKAVLGDCGFVSISRYSKQQRTAQSYRDIIIKNDDKHDMYSLGILILEIFYHIKPVVYDSYDEIQQVIKNTKKPHTAVLKQLFHEDREKRPTAREVLMILFKDTVPVYHRPKMVIKDSIKEKLGVQLDWMENTIKDNQAALSICRGRLGLKALLHYLSTHPMKWDIQYYLAAMLIIITSMFGNVPAVIPDIFMICDISPKKEKMLLLIDQLAHDEEFLTILYSK